jgi:5-(carboxyamino)imidazole ribonucleotide synthase
MANPEATQAETRFMLVGVLGGGQLGRMLGLAGVAMGMRFRFLDPSPDAPAKDVGELIVGGFDDPAALDRFVVGLDVATFEFENVPSSAVRRIAQRITTHPNADALDIAQDRVSEKRYFGQAGLNVHPWATVDDLASLEAGIAKVGLPAVLKTRRGGYDGKGQAVIRTSSDPSLAWESIGKRPSIVEAMVPFTRELSIIAARGRDGSFAAYPLVENHHAKGILRVSKAPAMGVSAQIERSAHEHCRVLLEKMNYVGVLAIEFFEHDGRLLANEMAPRVHNTGHWTIEGAVTSQFENHLRAVVGLPLGSCAARGVSAMHNIIGGVPNTAAVLRVPGAHLHLYGKEPRESRKIGHITVCGEDARGVANSSREIEALVAAAAKG